MTKTILIAGGGGGGGVDMVFSVKFLDFSVIFLGFHNLIINIFHLKNHAE